MEDRLGFVGKFTGFCWIFREFFTIVGVTVDQPFLVLSKQWKSKWNKQGTEKKVEVKKVLSEKTFSMNKKVKEVCFFPCIT